MNEEVWHRIMQRYIKDLEAIKILEKDGIIEDDLSSAIRLALLESIIDTFRSEVEE